MMWVPRLGAIRGQLGLGVELLGPDPVGPHAGGVDDVLRAHLDRLARCRLPGTDDVPAVVVAQDLGHLEPVGEDRAEALGLARAP